MRVAVFGAGRFGSRSPGEFKPQVFLLWTPAR